MPEKRGVLLPAYVVADESASMSPHQGELASGLASLCEGLRAEPMAAARIRLAVLGFSDDAQLRQELSDMRSIEVLPQFIIRGITSYGSAFRDLLSRIPRDVDQLKQDNYAVNRPVVFFLSDGQPTDRDWRGPHRQLTDRESNRSAPNIISCGIGSARADTMVEVATRQEFAFVAVAGADIGRAISNFFQALTASLVSSGQAMASGQSTLILEKPNEFHLAIDEV